MSQISDKPTPIEESNLIGSQSLSSPYGPMAIDNTYPTDATIKLLYKMRDLQRAVELYMWSLPIVQFQAWKEGQEGAFGTQGAEFTIYTTFNEHAGIITSNATTPYVFGWPNLEETGPLVVDMPGGDYAAAIMDWWEYPVCDMGQSGPDRGQGGKYLIIGPYDNAEQYKDQADYIFQSQTNKLSVGFRILTPGDAARLKFQATVKVYPLGSEPESPKFVYGLDAEWSGAPPLGLDYFKMLHRAIQGEPVKQRDKAFMGYLHTFGIEDGKPFEPSERAARILAQGANMGELLARANAMDPNFAKPYYEGTEWYRLIDFPLEQEDESRYYLDERAAWFYEAVTTSHGMKTETPGIGQVYLSTKRDKNGNFLSGSETYRFRVPANAPYEQFWSFTPYSEHSRGLIRSGISDIELANISSRDEALQVNDNGSVDLFIGPDTTKVPNGMESNWLKTVPGEGWFPYFRLYAPKQEFFDKTWRMGDIEKID
jgi:hypothetical protein